MTHRHIHRYCQLVLTDQLCLMYHCIPQGLAAGGGSRRRPSGGGAVAGGAGGVAEGQPGNGRQGQSLSRLPPKQVPTCGDSLSDLSTISLAALDITQTCGCHAVQLRYLERYGSSSSLRGLGGNGGSRAGGTIIRVDGAGVAQVGATHTRHVVSMSMPFSHDCNVDTKHLTYSPLPPTKLLWPTPHVCDVCALLLLHAHTDHWLSHTAGLEDGAAHVVRSCVGVAAVPPRCRCQVRVHIARRNLPRPSHIVRAVHAAEPLCYTNLVCCRSSMTLPAVQLRHCSCFVQGPNSLEAACDALLRR